MSTHTSEDLAKGSHTPGPWTVECVCGDDPHDICGPDRPGEGSPNLLASVAYDDDDPLPHLSLAEANANARLIAAAPDLLAALKELGDWVAGGLQASDEAWPDARCLQHTEEIAARARAAVDKAEGRS